MEILAAYRQKLIQGHHFNHFYIITLNHIIHIYPKFQRITFQIQSKYIKLRQIASNYIVLCEIK